MTFDADPPARNTPLQDNVQRRILQDPYFQDLLGTPQQPSQPQRRQADPRGPQVDPLAQLPEPIQNDPFFRDLMGVEEQEGPETFLGEAASEFWQGTGQSFYDMGTSLRTAGAIGADLLGVESLRDDFIESVVAREQEERFAPRVQSVEDISDLGDFVLWSSRVLGEQVPFMASIIAGGGITGVLGRLAGRGILSLGMSSRLATQFARFAPAVGGVGTAATLEGGFTGMEQLESVGELNSEVAAISGLAKGSLEAIVPLALGARLGIGRDLTGGLLRKISSTIDNVLPRRLATAITTGGAESVTESLQEVIDIAARDFVDENYDALGEDARSRLLNAASAGGLAGFIFGGILGGGGTGGRSRRRESEDLQDPYTQQPLLLPPPTIITPPPDQPTRVRLGIEPGTQLGLPGIAPNEQVTYPQTEPIEHSEPVGVSTIEQPELPLDAPGSTPQRTGVTTQVTTPVAQVIQSSDGTQLGIEFNRPAVASQQVALRTSPGDAPAVYALDPEQVDPDKTTVSLRDLPSDLEAIDYRISVLEGGNSEVARRALKEAIRLRDRAPAEAAKEINLATRRVEDTPSYQQALTEYSKAIEAGLRVRPREQDDFVLLTQDVTSEPGLVQQPFDAANVTPEQALGFGEGVQLFVRQGQAPSPGQDFVSVNLAQSIEEIPMPERRAIFRLRPEAVPEGIEFSGTNLLGVESALKFSAPMTGFNSVTEMDTWLDRLGYERSANAKPEELRKELNKAISDLDSGALPKSELLKLLRRGLRLPVRDSDTEAFALFPNGAPAEAFESITSLPEGIERGPGIDSGSSWERVLSGFQTYHGSIVDDTGALYDPENHKPGTVQLLHRVNTKLPADAKRTKALYQQMMKQFGMANEKLILFFDDIGALALPPGTNGGYWNFTGSDMHAIGIKSTLEKDSTIFTILHEFGHMIRFAKWEKLDHGVKEKILQAFNRFLVRANYGTTAQFVAGRMSPANMARAVEGHKFSEQQLLRSPTGSAYAGRSDYWFNFEEWFAEQSARWMSTADRPLTLVDKFFQDIAQTVKSFITRAMKYFKERGFDFTEDQLLDPEVEMREYLESAMAQEEIQGNPAKEIHVESEHRSKRENQEILHKYSNGEPIPPTQAESADMMPAMEKALGKRKAKEARAFMDKYSWFMKWMYSIQQMAKVNPHNSFLNRYTELVDQWNNFKMRLIARADERVREWINIGDTQSENLAKFIFDIEAMNYRTPEEKRKGVERQPTEEELIAFGKKHGLEVDALELYRRITEDFQHVLREIERVSIRDIVRSMPDNYAGQQAEIGRVKKEMEALRRRPYFPHARFGKFAVVVKDNESGATLYMSQHEFRRQALNEEKDILRQYKQQNATVSVRRIPQEAQPFRGLPPSLLSMIRDKLNLTEPQREWLDLLTVEMAPSASFRKRLARRRNVPGFSEDAMRSYASYFFHASNYLARIEYGPDLENTIADYAKHLGTLAGDQTRGYGVRDMMQHHLNHIMNPKPDWAILRSIAFHWWLGFSPASAALNFTQVPMVAYPFLAANFGDAGAISELKRGITSIHQLYRGKGASMDDNLLRAIDRAVEQGIVDESQATELAGVAGGSFVDSLVPGTGRTMLWTKMSHVSAYLFQASEKINRRVVFRAAYALAKKQPGNTYLSQLTQERSLEYQSLLQDGFSETEAKAYLAGADAVRQTQFQYAAHARPRFMEGRKASLFTFFMFLQSMLFFTRHGAGNKRFLLMMLAMGGMMGLPGSEDLNAIVRMLTRSLLGKDVNMELEARKAIIGMFDGQVPPDLILNGASRVGFGIPAAADLAGIPMGEFDMSASIGLGRVIPGLAGLGQPGQDWDRRMSEAMTDASGASFGIGLNLLRYLSSEDLSEKRAIEKAVPRALRNIMRAERYYTEGETTYSGAQIAEFQGSDPVHMSELIGQSIGFVPTRVSRRWDRDRAQQEAAIFWRTRRLLLMGNFDQGVRLQDSKLREAALADIRAFNNEVPWPSLRISGDAIRQSIKQRTRDRRLRELGLSDIRGEIPMYRDISKLFPEVQADETPPPEAGSLVDVESTERMR